MYFVKQITNVPTECNEFFLRASKKKTFRQDIILRLRMREEDTLDNTKVDMLRVNNHFFE